MLNNIMHILHMGVINIKTLNINSQEFVVDSDIEKGFLKGSIWQNLYDPYKYRVNKINKKNDYENALYMLQVYTFASVELSLYISTHPNNKEAINMLKKINQEKAKICEFIETRFKALSSSSEVAETYFSLPSTWSDQNVGV